MKFLAVPLQMMRTRARVCLFWLWLILQPIYWIKLSKNPILGAWIGIFQLNAPNVHIIPKNYCIDHNKILQSDRDPQVLTVGGPIMPQTNPRWRTAAFLKNRKIVISLQPIDRYWLNLVQWCILALGTPSANKIWQIWQSKMATAAILRFRGKIAISLSPQPKDRFWRHLAWWWVWALQTLQDGWMAPVSQRPSLAINDSRGGWPRCSWPDDDTNDR